MVSVDSSLFAAQVYVVGGVICVQYDNWADDPALHLVLLLVVSRLDAVMDADSLVSCIHVRVEVALIAFLSLLLGLYDGRDVLYQLGHELTIASLR